jgi:ElaB/YqjD/DUF883 family membrane-anchored ribosome-binding protein
MESVTGDNNFGKHGQEIADKTADKLQSGIRNAKDTANRAGDKLSESVEKVRATASDVGDSVVSYTRDNPVTTILISAAVGALIATVVSALLPSRD